MASRMYSLRSGFPYITGCTRPASRATSTNCALNGRPDGAGLACGLTPREALPCANTLPAAAAMARATKARRERTVGATGRVSGNYGRQVNGNFTLLALRPDQSSTSYILTG